MKKSKLPNGVVDSVMKRVIITIAFLSILCNVYSACIIACKARYRYEVYHPPVSPSSFEGPLGSVTLVGTGADGYYEKKWSNTYYLNIWFFSGFELNESSHQKTFSNNSIIAIVDWSNGGHSVITLDYWTTNMQYISEDEVTINSRTGDRISKVSGYDKEKQFWEIFFNP